MTSPATSPTTSPATNAATSPATSWDDVAATALLGTARRTLATDALPTALRPLADHSADHSAGHSAGHGAGTGTDPSAHLLDVAALGAVYRRAGMQLRPPRDLPEPAPADGRTVVPHDARARLRELIALHDADLLGQWLRLATQRGLAPPPAAIPALLDAVRERELAGDVVAAVGPRGIWLAAFQPHWRRRVGPLAGGSDLPTWATGPPDERRLLLTDPELLATLRQVVSIDDEGFLEDCLDDRRAKVRGAAAGLLSVLPGSAFAARAIERARHAVRVEGVIRRRIVVRPPEFDAGMRRDQLPAPPDGISAAGWLVLQLVQAVPLHVWPDDAADLPIEDRWASTLWHGWLEVSAREQDAAWARRLLPHEPRTGGRAPFVAKLLSAFPAPWPRDLSLAVLDWLRARGQSRDDQYPHDQYPHDIGRVLDLAARRLPVEAVDRLDAIGRRWPPGSTARYTFTKAATVMIYRRTMFEELQ